MTAVERDGHRAGRVLAAGPDGRGGLVPVELDPPAACTRCAAGRGCGAGLFAVSSPSPVIRCGFPPGRRPPPGARVAVTLPEDGWLPVVLRAYALPTLGLVGGALAPEPFTAWAASAGLLGGVLAWRLSERRAARAAGGAAPRLIPRVTEQIPEESP